MNLRTMSLGLLVLVAAAGCGKKAPAPSASASASAALSTPPAASSAAPPAVRVGAAAAYVPVECSSGRIYVNATELATLAGAAAKSTPEWMLSNLGDAAQAKAVVATLTAGGLDVTRDVKELALCARKGDDVVFAVGMDLSRVSGNVLDLIVKAAALGGEKMTRKQEAGLDFVHAEKDGGVLAQLGPNVLVAARSVAALQEAAKAAGAPGFGAATQQLVFVDITPPGAGRIRLDVVPKGDDLSLVLVATMTGSSAAMLKQDPKAFVEQTRKLADQVAEKLAKTPLKALANDVKSAKLSAEGEAVRAEATVPKSRVAEVALAAKQVTPDQVLGAMR